MISKLFITLSVCTVLTTAVANTTMAKSTVTINTTSTTLTSVAKSNALTSVPGTNAIAVKSVVTKQATTPKPIQCKVGNCDGTGDDCLNSTSAVKQEDCKSGEKCALVQKDINETFSHYIFSCAKDCLALTSQGTVACCNTANCSPDLSKPVKNNSGGDSGGDSIVPWNIMSFLSVAIMSVLVM